MASESQSVDTSVRTIRIQPGELLRLDIDYSRDGEIRRVVVLSDFTYFEVPKEPEFRGQQKVPATQRGLGRSFSGRLLSKLRKVWPQSWKNGSRQTSSLPSEIPSGAGSENHFHYDSTIYLEVMRENLGAAGDNPDVLKDLPEIRLPARVVGVRCYAGRRTSITGRVETGDIQKKLDVWLGKIHQNIEHRGPLQEELKKWIPALLPGPAKLDMATVGKTYAASGKVSATQPVSIRSIVSMLHEEIFYLGKAAASSKDVSAGDDARRLPPSADRLHGAILIAGRTKSCKSLITRGLIHSFLTSESIYRFLCSTSDRRPHLVTCEDPVETWFEPRERSDNPFRMVDYTPRDRTCGDYRALADCFRNGLRQTPACFLAGEVRDDDDIRSVLEFAATGHLVFATLHAGSLVDLFNKVFEATKANTPATRGLASQSILAAVHLQLATQTVSGDPAKSASMVIPALWRRTPASTAALVSAGVGALMPNCPTSFRNQSRVTNAAYDSLGRQFFARQLLESCRMSSPFLESPELIGQFINEARRLDLSGT